MRYLVLVAYALQKRHFAPATTQTNNFDDLPLYGGSRTLSVALQLPAEESIGHVIYSSAQGRKDSD